MNFGWPVRLAIMLALILPIAAIVYCSFARFLPAACGPGPCGVCAILMGEPDVAAGPMQMRIVPEWYTLPFYGILRSVPTKLLGVVAMWGAFVAPLSLVFFDWSKVPRNAGLSLLAVPVLLFGLGWVGLQGPFVPGLEIVGLLLTVLYYAWFIAVFPWLARKGQPSDQ